MTKKTNRWTELHDNRIKKGVSIRTAHSTDRIENPGRKLWRRRSAAVDPVAITLPSSECQHHRAGLPGTRVARVTVQEMAPTRLPAKDITIESETVSSMAVYQRALDHKIAILPGTVCSLTDRFSNYIRINCGPPFTKRMQAGIVSLGRIVSELDKASS